ncbi:hypothetical protein SBOR_1949 [Sclerotinia borealis F-4128]|uniref:Uncharacterized protein n=1 Tax=Sclerotinia borealis (strain F-4128) TaxID=1432307 RepID=W9CLI9_SCLBF|nr:hypothetical protein SBOR_1949 [Sclerotinia borealis F-4128]
MDPDYAARPPADEDKDRAAYLNTEQAKLVLALLDLTENKIESVVQVKLSVQRETQPNRSAIALEADDQITPYIDSESLRPTSTSGFNEQEFITAEKARAASKKEKLIQDLKSDFEQTRANSDKDAMIQRLQAELRDMTVECDIEKTANQDFQRQLQETNYTMALCEQQYAAEKARIRRQNETDMRYLRIAAEHSSKVRRGWFHSGKQVEICRKFIQVDTIYRGQADRNVINQRNNACHCGNTELDFSLFKSLLMTPQDQKDFFLYYSVRPETYDSWNVAATCQKLPRLLNMHATMFSNYYPTSYTHSAMNDTRFENFFAECYKIYDDGIGNGTPEARGKHFDTDPYVDELLGEMKEIVDETVQSEKEQSYRPRSARISWYKK